MKKLILAAFSLLFAFQLSAQNDDKGDKKSNEILDNLTAKTESYNTIQVGFTYKMQNKEAAIDEQTEGDLLIMGDKYKLNIAGQQVICDGTTVWTYLEEVEEVQINSMEDSEESITPSKLLTSYNKDYKSKYVKEGFMYGTTAHVLDLTPVEGKTYYKVRLVIDKAKTQLLEITIFDKNGSTYSYVINNFDTNVDVDEGNFSFNPEDYPDVEVIDMR